MKVSIVLISIVSVVVSLPVPQSSSLDHLIIPYDDTPFDYSPFSSDDQPEFRDEPTIITNYNVGSFRQGDYLQVPLGASYTVAGPDNNRIKKGIAKTQRFSLTREHLRPGLVL